MSVPVSKRGETQLAWYNSIVKLNAYTIKAVTNEKVIPKRYRWVIAQKIIDSANDMLTNAIKANSVYVKVKVDFDLRRSYQQKAMAETHALLTLIDIAYQTYESISDHKHTTWVNLILAAQKDLKNWIENDSKRYTKNG